jgi:hypothetical protein
MREFDPTLIGFLLDRYCSMRRRAGVRECGMKLRIKGNSIRLRVSQTDLAILLREGRIAETIRFASTPDATLTYALEMREAGDAIGMEYQDRTVALVVSRGAARRWAASNDVGIYGDAETTDGSVALLVEKDFACLDRNDPVDADAFPNPAAWVAC